MNPPAVTMERVPFDAVPGWSADDGMPAAFTAFRNSPVGSGAMWQRLSASVDPASEECTRSFFAANFLPHRLSHSQAPGLLTAYFEPEYRGSRQPSPHYRVPVYRRPADLRNIVAEADRASAAGHFSHMRAGPEGLVPYATREEIERGALAGQGLELVWLADPVEAFILHVQGSGRVLLDDGTVVRLTYDGKNGHSYTSVGKFLIEQGQLPAEGLTLDVLADWLRADPSRGRQVMWRNASFVFFRELSQNEPGPLGADGRVLTPGRSLAVDPGFHALGTPIFVDAPSLQFGGRPFRRLMIAQDVGSAIRGPERGDIFVGAGPDAGRVAGAVKHPGRFFVLLPRRP